MVCVQVAGNRVLVHLYHCKFLKEAASGARVDDLYAVCGQTQRSINWRGDVEALLRHLRHRDKLRRKAAARAKTPYVTRFEREDANPFHGIFAAAPASGAGVSYLVVQLDLSRARAITSQLELLAVSKAYLQETFGIAMTVYASP